MILGVLSFFSCETPQPDPSSANLEFTRSPEAQASFRRILADPSANTLQREINGSNSLTTTLHTPPCETCGVVEGGETRTGEAVVSGTPGNYTHEDRAGLAEQIIANGPDAFGTTEIVMDGRCMEVMNDSPTLPDGTYVPFTHVEATRMAEQWGWQIPTEAQALSIRRFAEENNRVYQGITRDNDHPPQRDRSIAALLNDINERAGNRQGDMAERAQRGRRELINGHFKWYVRDGGRMKIIGLSSNGRNSYYHTGASGAHSSQDGYVDYSHGVRLIRPCR